MPRKALRCKSCRALKNKRHNPGCQTANPAIYPNGPIYVETDFGSSSTSTHDTSSSSTSSSDSGGGGGCD